MTKRLYLALLVGLALVGPASAHHSNSAFDHTKQIKVSGTVKSWQFTNPHSWLDMMITYRDGTSEQWAFEAGSINSLRRRGITLGLFRPGDKVTIFAHPLKSGDKGGLLVKVTLSSGKTVQLQPPAK